jgi:ligand-binding sensor domain-containing protein
MRCVVSKGAGFYTSNFDYIYALDAHGKVLRRVLNTNGTADITEWQNRWCAATFGQGVVEIGQNGTALLFEKHFPTTGLMAERLVKTKDYLWWLTHERSVQAIDKNFAITHLSVQQGLGGKGVYDVFEGKDGSLWFATNKGVTKISFPFVPFTSEGGNQMVSWKFDERVMAVTEHVHFQNLQLFTQETMRGLRESI